MATRDKQGRFVKGTTGNPNGRPHKRTLTQALREKLDEDELAEVLIKLIRKGELGAVMYAYNRLEGAPKQATEISTPPDGEVRVTWATGKPAT